MQELIRENVNHVVLKADNFHLRHYSQNGGTPLEFWNCGQNGPLTHTFPGAGTSICWEVGQDPTQASASGILPHPIQQIGNPATDKYAYWCRESLFDAGGNYTITGFAPDFWCSQERIDDYFPWGDATWATAYMPKDVNLNVPPSSVAFKPTAGLTQSVMMVGNEIQAYPGMLPGREYRMFAGQCLVSFRHCPDVNAEAGLMFRTNNGGDGWKLVVNRTSWKLTRTGAVRFAGALQSYERSALLAGGLTLDVRSNNYLPYLLECRLGDRLLGSFDTKEGVTGPFAGLYAAAKSGHILFGNRAFFDVSTELSVRYSALPGGVIRGTYSIRPAPWASAKPQMFHRAGIGLWMNPGIAELNSMGIVHEDGHYEPLSTSHAINFRDHRKVWAGTADGTNGILAEAKEVRIDGGWADCGYFGLQNHVVGDSKLRLLVNALDYETARSCSRIDWTCDYKCTRQ